MIPGVVGSNPIIHPIFATGLQQGIALRYNFQLGPLAQLVEQLTLNQ